MRIGVGLSGGIDSTYAMLKLLEEGHEVVGIHLEIDDNNILNPCCSIEALEEVKNLCNKYNIPYYDVDAKEVFKEKVIKYFADTYLAGATPNPCVECNYHVKWEFLRNSLKKYNCDYLATGHYADVIKNEEGRYELIRPLDTTKDQTYMLWQLKQEDLAHTLFPLAKLKKEVARENMKKYSNIIAARMDSQDICFIDNSNYSDFLSKYFNKKLNKGYIYDINGKKLGEHKGFWNYTIGQRQGLGISAPYPLYVLEINALENKIIVGEEKYLYKSEVYANKINYIKYNDADKLRVKAKIRYRSNEADGTLYKVDEDTIKVIFDEPQKAITPGQSLVVYENNSVVVGGIIIK